MPEDPATAPTAADSRPERESHAARVARSERDQLVVDYLNRGVAIAEIATRLRLSEKRMRALVRAVLERRAPQPPEGHFEQ